MFKCNFCVTILTTLCLMGCTSQPKKSDTFLDVEKLCREPIDLVLKVSKFEKENFIMQKTLVKQWNDEQIWDLKKEVASKLQLDWLQLRFFKEKLQSVWFGPQEELDIDLARVGLDRNSLRNKNMSRIKKFKPGIYYAKDLNQKIFRLEHLRESQTGTTITCFETKNRK